jgi:hypothetical protein
MKPNTILYNIFIKSMSNIKQKITWQVYKTELDSICNKTRHIKTVLLKKARIFTILSVLINYPVKLILGITVGGGAIELFNKAEGVVWIGYLRIALEIMALILVITRDFFIFETQIEKFYAAAAAVDTFYKSVKYESFLQQGSENDRLETLQMYQKLYEEMIANNKIIQTVENISPATTPDEIQVRVHRQSDDMDSISSSSEEEEKIQYKRRASKVTEDRNRAFYIHSMLERMPT